MERQDWRKNSVKLLSLFLAVMLWIYVSNEQNPVKEKILDVNLENTGLAPSFEITGGMPKSARLRVQGNRNQLANLAPGDFKAVVNIPEGKTGDIALPVQVSSPTGLRVAQVIPEEVRITVDRIVDRQVSVAVSLRGTPAPGYTAMAPVYQPGTVVARGPSRVINEINQVTAVVDIQGATRDVDQTVPVNAGSQNISLSPSLVRVSVPIVNTVTTKTVPVSPSLTGAPSAGFTVRRSSTEPATVQITGPVEVLSAITQIGTAPVDIQDADKNLTRDAGLVLPQGITGIQPERVKVQVEIDKVEAPPTQDNNGGELTR